MSTAHVLSSQMLRHVPSGATPASIASEAREAGLSFLDGSAFLWGKRELAQWLSGPYAHVTRYVGPGNRAHRTAHAAVSDLEIEAILCDARWHVLAELEAAALPHGNAAFIDRSLTHGIVVPARADGGIAWLPVDAHLLLRTRVLSLFAADALARPFDYAHELYVCHRCEAVVFDSLARRRGNCGCHDASCARERAT